MGVYWTHMNNAINTVTQYAGYIKPDWAPPAEIFGPVWAILYGIIIITYGFIAYKFWKGEVTRREALPFILNLGFNIIYTYIQFELQSFFWASVDIVLVLGTLLWALFVIEKKYKWVMIANLPYLGWVSYATVLQLTITYLNR